MTSRGGNSNNCLDESELEVEDDLLNDELEDGEKLELLEEEMEELPLLDDCDMLLEWLHEELDEKLLLEEQLVLELLKLLQDELDEEEQEQLTLELVLLDFELLMLQLIELLMLTQELLLLEEEQEEVSLGS